MSDLKDKVANYLSTFIDLEEWKPTRDDPYGSSLVAATHNPDKKAASAAKAELKAKASAPTTGALDVDKPLGVERPKAVTPTLSPGAHATPPDVPSVARHGKEAEPQKGSPVYRDEPVGGAKSPEHTGGLQSPNPSPAPSPEHKKKLDIAAGSHIKAQVDKMFAGKAAVAAGKSDIETRAAKDAKLVADANDPMSAGRTSRQRYHDRRKAYQRIRATTGGKDLPNPPGFSTHSGETTGRVGTAVTMALQAASRGDKHKQHVLRQQTRATNVTMDTGTSAPAPVTDISPTTGKEKKFVSQSVLADLRKKAEKK